MAKLGRQPKNRVEDFEISARKERSSSSEAIKPDVVVTRPPMVIARGNPGSIFSDMESFDSIHSPFYLHSSDHPGLSVVNLQLDGSNYNNWLIAMRVSLDAKNKIGFVDGSLRRPEVNDPYFKVWSRCNSLVKAWIMNVVNREIADSILYYDDAVDMWNDLFTRFRVSNLPRKYQLEQSIANLKQGSLELSAYYTKKKTLWEQLSNARLQSAKRCDCDHVKELLEDAETSRIIQFLMGLNENFANIRGQILNMKPRPSLTEIYNMVDQDESQRIIGSSQSVIPTHSAFQVQHEGSSDQPTVLLSQGNYHKPKCSYYSRLGHTVERCYKKHGFPPGFGRGKYADKSKPSSIGATNLAVMPSFQSSLSGKSQGDQFGESMSKEQIQSVISYLSNQLHSSGITSSTAKITASTSTSAPVISQILGGISGNYTGLEDWSR